MTHVRIRDVRFEAATRLSVADQNDIASKLMGLVQDSSEQWLHEMEERVQAAWRHHGFFKVKVRTESRELSSDADVKDFALTFHMDEGEQYQTGTIRFLNAKQFSPTELRLLIPIAEGETFDTQKISEGLEAIRNLYGNIGFIDFTAVPEAAVDEGTRRVSLELDIDEGKQFHISSVKVLGLSQDVTEPLLRAYKLEPGEAFDNRQVDAFAKELNLQADDDVFRALDEKDNTICIVIDARRPH